MITSSQIKSEGQHIFAWKRIGRESEEFLRVNTIVGQLEEFGLKSMFVSSELNLSEQIIPHTLSNSKIESIENFTSFCGGYFLWVDQSRLLCMRASLTIRN